MSLFTTTCVTLITVAFNGIRTDFNDVESVSNEFNTQITPARYAFAIWGVIYTWQILWLGYAWSFVFRPKAARTIPAGAYWTYAVANCCNPLWIHLWVSKMFEAALVVFVLLNAFLYATVGLLWVHFSDAQRRGSGGRDYWLTWALPVNGLLCYTTWTTLATFINLATVLQYSVGFDGTDSATVSLVFLSVTLLVYIVLENTALRRFALYAFSVYPVIVWALTGILVAHWSAGARNAIYVLVLLLAVSVYAVIKTVSQRIVQAKPHDS